MIATIPPALATASSAVGGNGEISLTSEYVIPIFLAMIFAAALISSRTKVPHTIVLVGFGIVISFLSFVGVEIVNIQHFRIDPNLLIDFVIPPLIFEAMMNVDYKQFKAIRVSALLLATVGVVLATLAGGLIITYVAGLPLLVAFAFAALIAPTDAAIVIEIFKRVRVPKILSTLMESEAAFNDSTGAIVFSSIIAIAFASSGNAILGSASPSFSSSSLSNAAITVHNGSINLSIANEAIHFIIVFFGGAGIGHRLHPLMNDPFSETSLTIATVFGSVVLANSLGVSGLVAVAVAGLYFGNVTVKKEVTMSKNVRAFTFTFWEMTAFFAS
jgi:monovalent cation:H+ antiporter, CPA1 family